MIYAPESSIEIHAHEQAGGKPVDVPGLEGLLPPRVRLEKPLGYLEVSVCVLPVQSQKVVLKQQTFSAFCHFFFHLL